MTKKTNSLCIIVYTVLLIVLKRKMNLNTKKRQLRATTFIVKRLANMTRRLVLTGLSLMTDNIWTAYIHTDRDLNEQLLLKDSVLYPLLLSSQPRVTVTSCFVYKVIRTNNRWITCVFILSAG